MCPFKAVYPGLLVFPQHENPPSSPEPTGSFLQAWVWKLRQQIITELVFLTIERINLLQQLRQFGGSFLGDGGTGVWHWSPACAALPGEVSLLKAQHLSTVKGCLVHAQLGPAPAGATGLQGGHYPSSQPIGLSGKSKRFFLSQIFGPTSFSPYRLPPESFHSCMQEWGEFRVQRWLQDFLSVPAVRAGINPRGGDSKMPAGNVDPELPGAQVKGRSFGCAASQQDHSLIATPEVQMCHCAIRAEEWPQNSSSSW